VLVLFQIHFKEYILPFLLFNIIIIIFIQKTFHLKSSIYVGFKERSKVGVPAYSDAFVEILSGGLTSDPIEEILFGGLTSDPFQIRTYEVWILQNRCTVRSLEYGQYHLMSNTPRNNHDASLFRGNNPEASLFRRNAPYVSNNSL